MENFALIGLIVLFVLVLVFHLLVLLRVIPYQMVWGGRLKTDRDMYRFEAGSIAVNLLLIVLLLCCAGYIDFGMSPLALKIIYWCMAALFLLNTLGNLFSKSRLEKLIFTPVTLLISVFAVFLAVLS